MAEIKELTDEKLEKVVAGEGEGLTPKYKAYQKVQFRFDGGKNVGVGTIRQVSVYSDEIRYTVECQRYPGQKSRESKLFSIKEEWIDCVS